MKKTNEQGWLFDTSRLLSQITGLSFEGRVETLESGRYPTFRPTDIEYPNAFSLALSATPNRVAVSFVPDAFSRDLISSMGLFTPEQFDSWLLMLSALDKNKVSAMASVNKEAFQPAHAIVAGEWQSFELEVFASTLGRTEAERQSLEVEMLIDATGLLLCLLPTEEDMEEDDSSLWDVEGSLTRIAVNKYERSRRNRQLCIAIYGHKCQVCDLDFKAKYGEIGNGYVEVHHITPVSLMGGAYKLNPREDLIPLCSNCHRMLHRKTPPYLPSELKRMIQDTTITE